ncbi:MAG: branched-chain amino acid ABC transporter permease [Salinigranum sp.]
MTLTERLPVDLQVALVIAAAVVVLAIPASGVVPQFYVGLLISVMILALFATSFNLLYGYTGLLTFGHAAYFGVAGYTLALAIHGQLGLPEVFQSFFPALVLAVVVAGVFAAAFGYLCVQRGEIYFAMLTLAFNMMLYEVIFTWDDFTGGSDGVTLLIPPIHLGGFELNLLNTGAFYYLTFAFLVVSYLLLWRIVNSPYGELLIAIRENPERAEMVGVNVTRYQLSAFVIAGLFAGLAGSLFAVRTFIVTPDMLHWSMSSEPVLMTLLGGPGAFLGPTIGAFLFVMLEQFLSTITQFWQFGLGVILVPLVLFAPGGVVSLLRDDEGDLRSGVDVRAYLTGLIGSGVEGETAERDRHE